MKVERYIDHTISQITSRTIGKDPLSAANMWQGDIRYPTVQRNPTLWAYDLKDQLSGQVEFKTAWGQANGGTAITPRHLLLCAHYPDNFNGLSARFVSGDSTQTFETIIQYEYPPGGSFMTFEGNTFDLAVWLLRDELPSWVNKFTIIQFESQYLPYITTSSSRSSGKVLPTISISQGTNDPGPYQKLYIANNWDYNVVDPILNTGAIYGKRHPSPYIHPYHYEVYTGDSGTPVFTLINDRFYLSGIVVSWFYETQTAYTAAHTRFINELIRVADLSAGITPTGYTCTTQSFESLKL